MNDASRFCDAPYLPASFQAKIIHSAKAEDIVRWGGGERQ